MNFPDAAYPDDGDRVKGRRLRQRLWLPLLAFSVLLMGVARMAIRRDMSWRDQDEVERVRSVKPVGRFPTLEELKPDQEVVLTWDDRNGRVWTCVVEGGPESIATLLYAAGRWEAKGKIIDPPYWVQRVRLTEEQRAGFVCLVECLERGRWLDDRYPAIVRIECLQEGRVAAVREGFAPNGISCFNPDQILPDPELVAGLGRQRMKELYAFVSLRYEWPTSSGELE